jgi:hypothetical protein
VLRKKVKDLQKQLAKQRKGGSADEDASSQKNTSGPTQISQEAHVLHQENQALIKRAAMFEEEVFRDTQSKLQTADEQVKRYRAELEQKGKIIQQYVLRDHEAALQPDEKPKAGKVI